MYGSRILREGRRCENGTCGNCGQLTHCLPDNIDAFRPMLLEKFKSAVTMHPGAQAPGGRRLVVEAAE